MAQSPDIMLSQYAQDPLEGFTQEFPELCSRLHAHAVQRQVKKPKNKKGVSKRRLGPTKSYVITKNQKGKRLIKIEVIDIVSDTGSASSSEITDQEDNVLISAQYVVQDSYDEIMDLTDNLVQKISKKLCGDNF
ncbi:uncharacterized protein LOC114353955 [Ostrinia furnacalis]|uniref:uncharacterized protein LOC114353955 n=1 Tax=Ostrinia furnacalis TaxID=93504 RepID=UPI00103CF1C5|nr:uncharacterized protein LOC114353955 [Ostrinia furnacalis]